MTLARSSWFPAGRRASARREPAPRESAPRESARRESARPATSTPAGDVARVGALLSALGVEPGSSMVVVVDLPRPDELASALPDLCPGVEVTVLSTAEPGTAASAGTAGAASTAVTVRAAVTVRPARSAAQMAQVVAAGPSPDVVLDARGRRNGQRQEVFDALFLELVDGGRYVVAAPTPGPGGVDAVDARILPVTRHVERLRSYRSWRPERRRRELSDVVRALADAVAGLELGRRTVVVRKSGVHVRLLPDGEAQRVIERRGGPHRELERRPATTAELRGTLWTSDDAVRARRLRPGPFPVPDRVCAVFEDVVCAPRQLAVARGVVLPTAYHKPLRAPLQHQAVRQVRAGLARAPQLEGPLVELPGTYFHLDNEYAGHYGHVITQDLAKLWSWERAVAEYPDLRVLVSPALHGAPLPGYTVELLEAFGIGRERVTVLERPARVERLVTSTQAFQQPVFAAPEAREVWARVTRSLVERAGDVEVPERVFVSRRSSMRRRCLNGPEVEELFSGAGFAVVYPEDLSLPEQAAYFSRASVVAGYAGSALLNFVYSDGPATRIVLASTSYHAANEYFLASQHGGDLHYFWCEPVAPQVERPPRDFHWDYRLDLDRDGPALRALLDRVGEGGGEGGGEGVAAG
ncbi:hypothetical protein GCM10009809_03050 [Isoptericola hypogeus]|uniref:Glycosyltransferase 61 catalytic domain-containing protein n=1 Tax=Isoptericola hypogeus TaxID=300179 RepID=A0ABN2IR35_9MICO